MRVSVGERMLCRSLVTRVLLFLASSPLVGLVSQSLLPSLHWKLSMAIQLLCCIFICNLIQSCPLCQPANVSSVLHWPKSSEAVHKFREKFVPHPIQTFHCHFVPSCVDVINALQNVEWMPMILDSCVWPVQNCQHFPKGLVEVMGLKRLLLPSGPLVTKVMYLMVCKQHPELLWLSKCAALPGALLKRRKALACNLPSWHKWSTVGQKLFLCANPRRVLVSSNFSNLINLIPDWLSW